MYAGEMMEEMIHAPQPNNQTLENLCKTKKKTLHTHNNHTKPKTHLSLTEVHGIP